MKILCERCSAKYSISASLLKKEVTRFRCKKCQNIMEVRSEVRSEVSSAQSAQDALLDDEFDAALGGGQREMEDEKTTISARPIIPNDQEQGLVLRSALYDANRAEAAGQEDVDTRVFNIGALQMLRAERKNARKAIDHAGAPVAVVSPGLVTPLPSPQPTMDLAALAEQELPEKPDATNSSTSRAHMLLGEPEPPAHSPAPFQQPVSSPANGASTLAPAPMLAQGADVFQPSTSALAGHVPTGGLFDDGHDRSQTRLKWMLVGLGSVFLFLVVAGGIGAYVLLQEAQRSRAQRGAASIIRSTPRPTSLVPVLVRAPQAIRRVQPRKAPQNTRPVPTRPAPRRTTILARRRTRRSKRRRRKYRRQRVVRAPRKKRQSRPVPLPPTGWRVPPPPPEPSSTSDKSTKKNSPSIDVNELNRVLKGNAK